MGNETDMHIKGEVNENNHLDFDAAFFVFIPNRQFPLLVLRSYDVKKLPENFFKKSSQKDVVFTLKGDVKYVYSVKYLRCE